MAKGTRCYAYLDVETTSLSPYDGELTVVGLLLEQGSYQELTQSVGEEISAKKLLSALSGVHVLYTYNGSRFDLPYIQAKLNVDLTSHCLHHDLMYDCWGKKLYGGLKAVERQLGIDRESVGIDGRMAVQLWWSYRFSGDEKFLKTLLAYNREDVVNLSALRQKLKV